MDQGDSLSVSSPGVLGNDTDTEGDGLTAVLNCGPSNAQSFSLNSDGSFDYTPLPAFHGIDIFSYHADDGDPSNMANVSITVNGLPAAVDDTYGLNQDSSLTVPFATGVLANDSDPEDGQPSTAELVTDVTNGSLSLASDGSFIYSPNPDFYGVNSFTYWAIDNDGAYSPTMATVTLNIVNAADAPQAADDSYSVNEDPATPLAPADPGVRGNDCDPDNPPSCTSYAGLAVDPTPVATPSHGVLSGLAADGSFSYQPDANYHGPEFLPVPNLRCHAAVRHGDGEHQRDQRQRSAGGQ